jgi:hypothetical protein
MVSGTRLVATDLQADPERVNRRTFAGDFEWVGGKEQLYVTHCRCSLTGVMRSRPSLRMFPTAAPTS